MAKQDFVGTVCFGVQYENGEVPKNVYVFVSSDIFVGPAVSSELFSLVKDVLFLAKGKNTPFDYKSMPKDEIKLSEVTIKDFSKFDFATKNAFRTLCSHAPAGLSSGVRTMCI